MSSSHPTYCQDWDRQVWLQLKSILISISLRSWLWKVSVLGRAVLSGPPFYINILPKITENAQVQSYQLWPMLTDQLVVSEIVYNFGLPLFLYFWPMKIFFFWPFNWLIYWSVLDFMWHLVALCFRLDDCLWFMLFTASYSHNWKSFFFYFRKCSIYAYLLISSITLLIKL